MKVCGNSVEDDRPGYGPGFVMDQCLFSKVVPIYAGLVWQRLVGAV